MELRQAEYVVAVVDHGSYTAASEALFVSQPAISFSLAQLREELGEDLFVPGSRPAQLTEFGHRVAAVARSLVEEAEVARSVVRRPSTLTIAVEAGILGDPVAGWIRTFSEQFPGVHLRVIDPGSRESALAWLASHRCEVAFVAGSAFRTHHVAHDLVEQELALVAASEVRLPPGDTLQVADMGAVPLILPPLLTWNRAAIAEAFDRAGVVPKVAVECEPHEAIWPLVLHGAGAALLPPLLTEEARHRGLAVRRVEPRIVQGIRAVRRTGPPSPALTGLLAAAGVPDRQVMGRSGPRASPGRGTPAPGR